MKLDQGAGAAEEGAQVIEGVEPDFGGDVGGAEIGQMMGEFGLAALFGELVVVEIDDAGFFAKLGDEADEVLEIHRFGGEKDVEPPFPVAGKLLGEPVRGDGQSALDAAWGEFEKGPAVAAVAHDGFEHGLAGAAEEGLEGEDVELGGHNESAACPGGLYGVSS